MLHGQALRIDCSGTYRITSYNIDETRLQEGEAGRRCRDDNHAFSEKMLSDSTAWVIILESISTSGRRPTPLVVFLEVWLGNSGFLRLFATANYLAACLLGWYNGEIMLPGLSVYSCPRQSEQTSLYGAILSLTSVSHIQQGKQ